MKTIIITLGLLIISIFDSWAQSQGGGGSTGPLSIHENDERPLLSINNRSTKARPFIQGPSLNSLSVLLEDDKNVITFP